MLVCEKVLVAATFKLRRLTLFLMVVVIIFANTFVFSVTTYENKEISDSALAQYDKILTSLYNTGYTYVVIKGEHDTGAKLLEQFKRKSYKKELNYFYALCLLGDVYSGKNDTLAISNYLETVEVDSNHAWVKQIIYPKVSRLLTKHKLYEKGKEFAEKAGETTGAIRYMIYLKEYEIASKRISELILQGDTRIIEQVVEVYFEASAETEIEKILAEKMNSLNSLADKGIISDDKIKDEKTRNIFNAVKNGYVKLSKLYYAIRNHEKTQKAIENAKGLVEGSTELYREILDMEGDVLWNVKEYKKAIERYEEIVEGKGKEDKLALKVYPKLYNMYNIEKRYEDALKISKQFGDIEGAINSLNNLGRGEEAIEYIDKLLNEVEGK